MAETEGPTQERSCGVALVTGSARGIGRGIALELAGVGYDVGIDDVGIDAAQTDEGAGEVRIQVQRRGRRAVVVDADVSNGGDRERLLATVTEQLGPVDLLVNNAGVAPRRRLDILETSEESYDRLMGINLRGPFFLTQLVARQMVERREQGQEGRMAIVFISSVSAYASSPSRGEYCLSKAGVSMARALFSDRLSGHDIGVYEIRPGIIDTAMTAVVKSKYDKLIAEGLLPQKRWGTPQDVGKAVAAIAMGYLDYSTGQVIEVGGGFGLRRL